MESTMHDTCESLLAAMVGFDTVNSRISGKPDAEVELAIYLEAVAGRMGFATQRLPLDGRSFNLLVTHEVSPSAPWLLFESHLDTVTVDGMVIDPFEAEIRDGRIYGRGSCDTKGTGASMLWALQHYALESGGTNVAIVYTTDEEVAKAGAAGFAGNHLPDLPWRPVGAVIGEPTLLVPVIAHNGVARFKLHTRGVAAHSSNPSAGKSAISMMMRVIDMLESRYIPSITSSHPLTGQAACSVNVIRGGKQVNVIPDHCEIEIDRRVVPGENGQDAIRAVELLLDELRQAHPDLAVDMDEVFIDTALDPAGSEGFVAVVQAVLRAADLPGDAEGAKYGTDASQFSAIGIPSVVLGPGNIDQAHTKDEWLALDQLHRGIEVYLDLMRAAW